MSTRSSQTAPLVVGVDGSERSRDALALAVSLDEPGQRVILTHVHPYEGVSNLLSGGDYEQLLREISESTLAAAQEALDPETEREMRLVANRSAAAGMQALAEETGASLIVVGSSHRSGLGRVVAGSVAESVLSGAPVPVAIAPHGYADAGKVLATIGCGYDGSPASLEALGFAAALSRRLGARLQVLAVHSALAFGGVSTAGGLAYRSANATVRDTLERQMEEAIASLPQSSDASGRVLDGDAAAELSAASADLDLLVLGSRNYGPVRRVLLGSVSRAVARSAACPLVVLPRGVSPDAANASGR